MRVLILAEDFVKDEQVLQPIIEAMIRALGQKKAKVVVCKDPRFHGTVEALKWASIEQALDRHRGMVDLFLLCVDRDGNKSRRATLDTHEASAKAKLGDDVVFFAEHAWQEVEVWVLAGHDLPKKWNWKAIREEQHPKETYFVPFAESQGVLDLPGEGHGKLAREAAARYSRVRNRCREDVLALESRIQAWLSSRG